jgi:hypothetical protein
MVLANASQDVSRPASPVRSALFRSRRLAASAPVTQGRSQVSYSSVPFASPGWLFRSLVPITRGINMNEHRAQTPAPEDSRLVVGGFSAGTGLPANRPRNSKPDSPLDCQHKGDSRMTVYDLKMPHHCRYLHLRFVTAIFFAMLLATSAAAPVWPQALSKGKGNLRVMTYNVYEGADLTTAFSAQDQNHFVAAISAILADVRATNPPVRAEAIARQIGKAGPTLVSLQEVTQWSTCPTTDYQSCSGPQTVLYDLLDLIKDALQAQGLDYKEVGRVTVNELIAPAMTGTGRVIVFYTQRSAILARADINAHELRLFNVQSAQFNATNTVPIAGGGTFVIRRAWISVDVKFHQTSFRFIDTQLEAFDPGTNYNQSQELISGPAKTSLPVVIAMDSNSKANSPANDFTPTYTNFLKNGFKDAWTETQGDAPGDTSGQDPTLMNPVSHVTRRIDLILLHGDLDARAVELFGGQQSDRTSGLWPSDHLAVAARLGAD